MRLRESWKYIDLPLSVMARNVIARCPRVGMASKNILQPTVLVHTAPCQHDTGPEIVL